MSIDTATLDALITQWATLNQQIEQAQAGIEQIKNTLKEHVQPGTSIEGATARITVTKPRRTLNTTAISKALPVAKNPGLYTPKLDTKKVKAAYSENQLTENGWYKEGTPVITLKPLAGK